MFTDEQRRAYCTCVRRRMIEQDGPDEFCPLHGRFTVEWAVFRREIQPSGVTEEFQRIGVSYDTDYYPGTDALKRAEDELSSVKRDDRRYIPNDEFEYQLRYRLLLNWQVPRA